MASYCSLTIMGNLVKDPELKELGGKNVSTFTVAVNGRKRKDGNTDVVYYNVSAWNGLADNCQKYLAKGRTVLVTGSLSTREYEDKNKINRTSLDVYANNVVFLSAPETKQTSAQSAQQYVQTMDQDLPF